MNIETQNYNDTYKRFYEYVQALYGSKGIRCIAISPGAIMTSMAMEKAHKGGIEKMAPHLAGIKRYGEPQEVAQAALFLVSDESRYLNGSTLTVDGGWTLF